MGVFKIFIVEDDKWYGELLKYHLSLNDEFEVTLFDRGEQCLKNFYQQPDVICMDFGLPDMTGDILLEKIRKLDKYTPIIVISGQEDISIAVKLLKNGANDYIVKDSNAKELLWNSIMRLRETVSLKREVEDLKVQLTGKYDFEKRIIGQSKAIREAFMLIDKASRNNINVSITGETGTGKEVVAKAIHYKSHLNRNPFVAVNMSAIPAELMESELFGYEKGAFTGAAGMKIGKFEEAQGGSLFLDEIAELNLNLQSKILRVLQEREVVRIGGTKTIKLNFRLITATHKNLLHEVKNGRFREDLYYRIIGLPIELPPLREREGDVLLLAQFFAADFAKSNKFDKFIFSNAAKSKLLNYRFPGNVRELKAVVDLACVMAENSEIQGSDIKLNSEIEDELFSGEEKKMEEYTNDIIVHFLKKYDNNVVVVAEKLGIGKSTIYNLIKKGEIQRQQG